MIFSQYVVYVLIYDNLKFRKDPSITAKEIAYYISVAFAVALSVHVLVIVLITNVGFFKLHRGGAFNHRTRRNYRIGHNFTLVYEFYLPKLEYFISYLTQNIQRAFCEG